MRCQGSPERESSCVSRGKTTMAVGRFIYFSARNNCSPPESCGVREKSSRRTNKTGVWMLCTRVIAERLLYSCGSSKGGALHQFGWKRVKSATYHQEAQLEMSRCETAGAKRSACVCVQSGG